MTDTPDFPEDVTGEETPPETLAARVLRLQQDHRDLDQRIAELYEFPFLDQLKLQRLKRKKLLLKDAISRLNSDLIPDLNA